VKLYRLLVDWDVVVALRELSPRTQREVYAYFSKLKEAPDMASEYFVSDESGRELGVFIIKELAFYYWIDFADRHVKVLAIGPADRSNS
jgi:hypothetical protein